jgi:hypothetical protein
VPSYDVFISHKSEYKPWVEWLGKALIAHGRSVFLDIWNLVPGDSWVEGLHRGLDNCRAALLVATPEVVNSGWIREEYNALQRRRQQPDSDFRLVPIVFGELPNLPFLANLQAVDCRDPEKFHEWFHRILCGLDGKEPGPAPSRMLTLDRPPALSPPGAGAAVPGEESFVQRLMKRVSRADCPPMLVAARGMRFQGPVIQALVKRAIGAYGSSAVLHVTPPFSDQITAEDCFAEIGRQCGFGEELEDATAFVAALEQKLGEAGPQFMLVTGFESAAPLCRKEFAGALRALAEHRTREFRVVLLGGQRLMEQKYAAGDLSFLSHATVEEWPQPTVDDLIAWQQADFPNLPLTRDAAAALIATTGEHPGLLRYCLERWDAEGGSPLWKDWSYACPELWETWYRLTRYTEKERLRELLGRDTLGPAVSWPADATARALYWADLLAPRGRQLGWRAEVLREVGREVVG